MLNTLKKLLFASILSIAFSFAMLISTISTVAMVPIVYFTPKDHYVRRVLAAASRLLAALLGGSGRHTLSAECAERSTIHFKILHDLLNGVKDKHCEKEAQDEHFPTREQGIYTYMPNSKKDKT